MSDLSVIVISISVIVLCWAVVRINQRLDHVFRNRKFLNDLGKSDEPAKETPVGSHLEA